MFKKFSAAELTAAALIFTLLNTGFAADGTPAETGTMDSMVSSQAEAVNAVSGFSGMGVAPMFNGIDASADSYEYVGNNIIARGHVVVSTRELHVSADKVIINISSRDMEAVGNVTLTRKDIKNMRVTLREYRELCKSPSKNVKVLRYVSMPNGTEMVEIEVSDVAAAIQAERIAGNLKSGTLKFRNMALKTGALYAAASEGQRSQDGTINLKNVRMTTCEYIIDDHDHYAFTATSAVIEPRSFDSGLRNYNPDQSDHSVLALNPVLRLWDVPVFWLPALYKPKESDSFGVDFQFGSSSDWGFWFRTHKGLSLYDDPSISAGVMVDYYSDRGVGVGVDASMVTGNSRTEFFGYGIRDRKPYQSWDVTGDRTKRWYEENLGFDIPKNRYELKFTNLTHITPRLDFRGQLDYISDVNFLQDYFGDRYDQDIQPPTYAALEYQFDRASVAVYANIRVNDFDSVMERAPEARLDFQRQELFAGLYYQGENSAGYYYNKWRSFDEDAYGILDGEIYNRKLNNYKSARFDSLHFLYYPLRLDFVNIIPRAGVRFTGYSHTSDEDISNEDLALMFYNNRIDSHLGTSVPTSNFEQGGGKFRFMGEIGVEANTKIYRTWQNVKSSWLELDGLRHVAIPYVNYTFIPKPTVDYEKIYYFDDVDRLSEQNFVRIGLINRLQTRSGFYGSEKIREWISLENYWDFHMIRREDYNNIGDFATRLRFTPMDGLTLTSTLLWDVGQNNDHNVEATRGDRESGRPGLSALKFIDTWNTTLDWSFAKDWHIFASYIYSDAYHYRSAYSMGSMIDMINATSTSISAYYPMAQDISFGITFPTYIDKRMKAGFYMTYDVEAALMRKMAFRLMRNFHCFDVGCEFGRSIKRDSDYDKKASYYVSAYIALSGMPSARLGAKQGF